MSVLRPSASVATDSSASSGRLGIEPHHPLTTWLHALMACLLVGQLALGWWMLDLPKSPPGLRADWFNVHKSIGLMLCLLWLFRLGWLALRPRRASLAQPRWQRFAAHINHGLLYLAMGLAPAAGLLGSGFSPYPLRWFGWTLPRWSEPWPEAKALCSQLHERAVYLLMVCIAMHLLAVAWHLIARDFAPLGAMRPRLNKRD